MKAMILAAGLGTRFKPFTDHHPKALAVVNNKTLLQRNIEYLASYAIKDLIINIHHFGDQIKNHLSENRNFGANISFSDESNNLLETGGGLKKAQWFFNDDQPFVLINSDILTDLDLNKMRLQHTSTNSLATLAVCDRVTSRYFLFDDQKRLSGWRNLKTEKEVIVHHAHNLKQKAFSGIHIISPTIFPYLISKETESPDKFSIVEPYLEITKTEKILSFDHTGAKLIDVGKPGSIEEAEKLFA